MQLTITSVDYAPSELEAQCPLIVDLVRELPSDDRPDYWIGKAQKAIKWVDKNIEREVFHLVLAARWEGTRIEPNAKNLPVGIAYVTDETLLNDDRLDLKKCAYVVIGFSHESGGGGSVTEDTTIFAGTIGRFFGTGNQK